MTKINVIVSERKIISSSKYSTKFNLIVILLILNPNGKKGERLSLERLTYMYSLLLNKTSNKKVGITSAAWNINGNIKPLLIKGNLSNYWGLTTKGGVFIELAPEGLIILRNIIEMNQFNELRSEISNLKKKVTQANCNRQKLVWS
jgi:hypothetical protein